MDFTLTETQKEYQEKARRLAVERLAPKYQEREKCGSVEKDLQIEMGKLGLIAPEIPVDLGGRGLDCVTAGIVVEEIARGDFNVSYVQIVGSLVGQILSGYARPEVTAEWVRRSAAARRSWASVCRSLKRAPTRGCRVCRLVTKGTATS